MCDNDNECYVKRDYEHHYTKRKIKRAVAACSNVVNGTQRDKDRK